MAFHSGDTVDHRDDHDCSQPLLRPLRVLALGAQEPDWDFMQTRLTGQEWELKQCVWADGLRETLQHLRTEHWDCLLISLLEEDDRFTRKELACFLASIRESGISTGVLGLTCSLDVELAELFQEYQCDFHEVRSGWFSPAIGVMINRTMQLQSDALEKMKLRNREKQRCRREQEEAEVILAQQRTLLQEIFNDQQKADQPESSAIQTESADALADDSAFAPLAPQYEQVLRSFVIMGVGRLEKELFQLASELQQAGSTPRDLLALHLECVEKMVERLGHRSSRHVVQKADRMLLELMVILAENYRCKVG